MELDKSVIKNILVEKRNNLGEFQGRMREAGYELARSTQLKEQAEAEIQVLNEELKKSDSPTVKNIITGLYKDVEFWQDSVKRDSNNLAGLTRTKEGVEIEIQILERVLKEAK